MIVIIDMALNHQKMLYYWHLEQTPPVGKQKIGLIGHAPRCRVHDFKVYT